MKYFKLTLHYQISLEETIDFTHIQFILETLTVRIHISYRRHP